MAPILPGKTRCVLCGKVLEDGDNLIATSHFIIEKSDPLWRYSDASFHYPCFLGWKSRHEFVCRFNQVAGGQWMPSGKVRYMTWDGKIRDGSGVDVRKERVQSILVVLDELWMRAGFAPLRKLLGGAPAEPGNELFRKSWEELTVPEHFGVIKDRLECDLNPMAREWMERALEDCRSRGSTSPGGSSVG